MVPARYVSPLVTPILLISALCSHSAVRSAGTGHSQCNKDSHTTGGEPARGSYLSSWTLVAHPWFWALSDDRFGDPKHFFHQSLRLSKVLEKKGAQVDVMSRRS